MQQYANCAVTQISKAQLHMQQESMKTQKLIAAKSTASELKHLFTPLRLSRHSHARRHHGRNLSMSSFNNEIQSTSNFQTLDEVDEELDAINIEETLIRNIMRENEENEGKLKLMLQHRQSRINLIFNLSEVRLCNYVITYNGQVIGGWRSIKCKYAQIAFQFSELKQRYYIITFYPLIPLLHMDHKMMRVKLKDIEHEDEQHQKSKARRVPGVIIVYRRERQEKINAEMVDRIRKRKAKFIEQCAQQILSQINEGEA